MKSKIYTKQKAQESIWLFEQLTGLNLFDDPVPYLWLQKKPKEMSTTEIERLLDKFPDSQNEEIIPYRIREGPIKVEWSRMPSRLIYWTWVG